MLTNEEAKNLANEVLEKLPEQNRKDSRKVVFINVDTGVVGIMNKDHSPNGWTPIYFGGCSTLPEIYGRINNEIQG